MVHSSKASFFVSEVSQEHKRPAHQRQHRLQNCTAWIMKDKKKFEVDSTWICAIFVDVRFVLSAGSFKSV